MSLARLAPPLTLKRSVIDVSHIPCCLPDGSFTVRLPTDADPTFRAEASGLAAPYYWDARLELQYSMIHPLAWEALVGDDCDDALRMERLAFWLPDTVGNSSEREAVLQSYEQLAWRRLHRWQRILALHRTRESYIKQERSSSPKKTVETVLQELAVPPDWPSFVPPAPMHSVWPLPEPAPLRLVNLLYHSKKFSCTAAAPNFDPSLFGSIDIRVLDHPPLCVKRMCEPPPAYLPPRPPHSGLSNRQQTKKASKEATA